MPLTGAFRAAFLPQNRAFFVPATLADWIFRCEFPHSDESEHRAFTFSTRIRKGINSIFRTGVTSNPQNYLTPLLYRSVHYIPEWIFVFCHFVDINNAFACSGLTATRSDKIKASPRRKRRVPFWPEPDIRLTPYPCKTAAAPAQRAGTASLYEGCCN